MEDIISEKKCEISSKKRNLSEVSANSISPTPSPKMSNVETTPKELSAQPELSRLESAKDLGSDTGSLHQKVDTVIDLLQKMMVKFDNLKECTSEEVSKLKQENAHLNVKVQEAEGRMTRMSRDLNKLNAKCEDLQFRSMSNNILIHNVTEEHAEDIYEVVQDIFVNKLKFQTSFSTPPPIQQDQYMWTLHTEWVHQGRNQGLLSLSLSFVVARTL